MPIQVGQVTADSPLGESISTIIRDSNGEIRTIFEVGTGSGLGTTKVIADAMGRSAELTTLEGDADQYKVALNNIIKLAHRTLINPYLGLLHRGIKPYWHPVDSVQHREMYAAELRLIGARGPVIDLDDFDRTGIDMVVLDGGEWTSDGDFLILQPRVKIGGYIVLDDCNQEKAVKNAYAYEMLRRSSQWCHYEINLQDRNGWAIFRKIA
jgi:predicted O-methyltransferase YrrM